MYTMSDPQENITNLVIQLERERDIMSAQGYTSDDKNANIAMSSIMNMNGGAMETGDMYSPYTFPECNHYFYENQNIGSDICEQEESSVSGIDNCHMNNGYYGDFYAMPNYNMNCRDSNGNQNNHISSGVLPSYRTAGDCENSYPVRSEINTSFADLSSCSSMDSTHYPESDDSVEVDPQIFFDDDTRGKTKFNSRPNELTKKFIKSTSRRGRPVTYYKPGHHFADSDGDDSEGDNYSVVSASPSKVRRGAKNILLWKFILEELDKPESDHVQWVNRGDGIFKFVDTAECSKLWGRKKKKDDMNFEKLSRGIRHYYRDGLMSRMDGTRLVYKFHWERVPKAFRR